MKRKFRKGFTLVELLIGLVIISLSSIIISTLFVSSLKTTSTHKVIQDGNIDSKSQLDMAIVEAKSFSDYYEKYGKKGKHDASQKPRNYKDPIMVSLDRPLQFINTGVSVNKVQGYRVYSNSQRYEINDELKDYQIFTFLAEGYAEPVLAGFSKENDGKLYVGEKRFNYFFAEPENVVNFNFKVGNLGIEQVKSVRVGLMRSKNYNDSSETFILPYTDEDDDINFLGKSTRGGSDSESFGVAGSRSGKFKFNGYEDFNAKSGNLNQNLNPSDSIEGLRFLDSDVFITAQTLNNNGYSGNIVLSYNGTGSNQLAAVHYIGLPYLKNLVNHNDANLVVRPSKNEKNTWYSLAHGNKDLTKLKSDFSTGPKPAFLWKDVRDYTEIDNLTGPGMYNLDAAKNKAFKFEKANGKLNSSDGVSNTVGYERSEVIAPDGNIKFAGNNGQGTIIMKCILNNQEWKPDDYNITELHEPYRLISVNMDDLGKIKNHEKTKGTGFQIFVDNKNKLWLNIAYRDVETIDGQEIPITKYKLYDLANEFVGTDYGLYDSKLNPYLYKDGREFILEDTLETRKKYFIISVACDDLDIKISLLGYNGNKFTHFTKTYEMENPADGIMSSMPVSIGGSEFMAFDNHMLPVSDLSSVPTEKRRDIEISNFLYYDKDLTKVELNGSPSALPGKTANDALMDYLYRKSLSNRERDNFDAYYAGSYL